MKKIEILAPAGSVEALKAAINGGCDAVYVGGNQFGARAYANNFNEEELLWAIDYVHLYGKQLFLTVNTLLKEQELSHDLYRYLKPFYEAGLDAVIVQDLGVLHFIHEHFPDLPIHCSTQMSLTMANGVNLLKDYGVTRLVTARELTLDEIKEIRNNTTLEIESFVHGALCYSFSGQCLMSSMLGGRSGNRGRCAQTCRMPYELIRDKQVISNKKEPYLLSPKDICTLTMIPELVESGIDSFKIEGRMKRPEYTAFVSYAYRKYVDLYLSLGKANYEAYLKKHQKEFESDLNEMMELYNRGNSSTGYYNCHNGSHMMSPARPNHNGILVGELVSVTGNQAEIKLNKEIYAQDVLEMRGRNEVNYDYTVKDGAKQGSLIRANFKSGLSFQKGDKVYRTKKQVLLQSIGETFLSSPRKIKLDGVFYGYVNQPVMLTVTKGDVSVTVTGEEVQQAQKAPVSEEKVKIQLNKLNDTIYEWDYLHVELGDDVFMPVGWINELRRQAIDRLEHECLHGYRRNGALPYQGRAQKKEEHQSLGISILVSKPEQIKTAVLRTEVTSVYLRLDDIGLKEGVSYCKEIVQAKKEAFLVLPHVFRKNTYQLFEQELSKLSEQERSYIDGFVVKNIEEYEFILRHGLMDKQVIIDYNFYTMNEDAKAFFRERKITHFTTSVELNYQEMKQLGVGDSDVVVYGHIPLMTTANCLVKNSKGCTKKTAIQYLKDRYNKNFIVVNHCKYCYNNIYNANPLSLLSHAKEIKALCPKNIRLEFTIETKEEMKKIIDAFITAYVYQENTDLSIGEVTKGHFKRGIE